MHIVFHQCASLLALVKSALQHRDMGGIGTFHWAFPKSVEVRLGECFGRMLTSLGMNELELNTWSSYVGELLSVAGSILCHEVGM